MIAEKYDDVGTHGEDALSSVRDYLHRGSDQMGRMVDERPGASIMMAGLIGFGVGLLLTQVLVPEEQSYFRSSDRSAAERIGRNLLDRIEHAMPAMLRDRISK